MKRAVLLLPVCALILQIDRVWPFPKPPVGARPYDLSALPARDIGKWNRPADPLNMIFVGSEAAVVKTLTEAGWHRIPDDINDCFWAGLAELFRGEQLKSFPPMSDFRVYGRVQDMNWAKVVRPITTRHHFRLWKTGMVDGKGREVWWGSGNCDLDIRLWDLSHQPHPDMNLERQHVADSLPGVEKRLVALAQIPLEGVNAHGYPFFTDGKAMIFEVE